MIKQQLKQEYAAPDCIVFRIECATVIAASEFKNNSVQRAQEDDWGEL